MLRSCSGTFQPLTANDLGVVETDSDSTPSATLVEFPPGAGDGLLSGDADRTPVAQNITSLFLTLRTFSAGSAT